MYDDYKPFKMVSVLEGGTSIGITSSYDAAKYLLERWPDDAGPKASNAKAILLKCLEGGCSPEVACVAFVEAAREAGIFIETAPRPPATGRLGPRWWGKRKPARRVRYFFSRRFEGRFNAKKPANR